MCVAWGPWSFCWGPSGHEWARWTEGAGRSLSRGWECALCREEAECPPQRESPVTTVWRSVVECPLSPAPSVLFLHNKEDRETGSDWAALDLPPCLRGGGGSSESLNVTIIDRYLCETCMRPALQPVVVGSLLHSTNKDDFSMPQVKMRYVMVVLTMRQVCFRSRTLSCVTASSEMCLAQLWELDDSCSVGAIDGV